MSTLETRIAEVLDDAIGYDCTHQDFDNPLHADAPGKCHHCYQQALKLTAALAPVIREQEAEAWDACVHAADKQWTIGHTSAQLLRNTNPYRADKLDTL